MGHDDRWDGETAGTTGVDAATTVPLHTFLMVRCRATTAVHDIRVVRRGADGTVPRGGGIETGEFQSWIGNDVDVDRLARGRRSAGGARTTNRPGGSGGEKLVNALYTRARGRVEILVQAGRAHTS